jgi:hypothetical protein
MPWVSASSSKFSSAVHLNYFEAAHDHFKKFSIVDLNVRYRNQPFGRANLSVG